MGPKQRPLRQTMVAVAIEGERYAPPYEFGEKWTPLGKGGADEDDLGLPEPAFALREMARSVGNFVGGHEDAQHFARAAIVRLPHVAGPHDHEQIIAGKGPKKLPPAHLVAAAEGIVDRVAKHVRNARF